MGPGLDGGVRICRAADMADADFEQFLGDLRARYRWLPSDLAKHYARLYGTRAHDLIGSATCLDELGTAFTPLFRERKPASS